MSGTIYKAAAGALLQQMRLDLLTNNLANVNTAGYKADKAIFRVPDEKRTPQKPLANPVPISPYAPPLEARIDFSGGPVHQTGNPLDVAIIGDGFFEVLSPDGSAFTRKGSFSVNDQGLLSTSEGWPVLGQGGEIAIDGAKIEIGEEGEVYVDGNLVDTLKVVDFARPYALRKSGDTLFKPEAGGTGQVQPENTHIAQGFIETSNVDAIRTMTEIIETLRVFESYQRVIRAADDTLAKTVNEVGQSA